MEIIETPKGSITLFGTDIPVIRDPGSFLDLLFSTESDTIALKMECLDPSFFDLKSGLAGELLQKLSNYKKRLIVLGDFEDLNSKSPHDFIYESNRHGVAVFTDDLDKAVGLLKRIQ